MSIPRHSKHFYINLAVSTRVNRLPCVGIPNASIYVIITSFPDPRICCLGIWGLVQAGPNIGFGSDFTLTTTWCKSALDKVGCGAK